MKGKIALKLAVYRLFIRFAFLRDALYRLRRLGDPAFYPSTGHLSLFGKDQIGPVQLDEAQLLYSLARVTRPATIVEFGFNRGHSALNFLLACPGADVFSYDIDPFAERIARRCFGSLPRFSFFRKSQADFDPADTGNRPLDLIFIDGAHDLALNQETFRRLAPHLSEEAVIAVHDTGLWDRSHLQPIHLGFAKERPGWWLDGRRFQHQKDERLFVNWICEAHPEFVAIHLGTTRVLRHGLTLLQRRRLLAT